MSEETNVVDERDLIANVLLSIGWKDTCDAQWDGLLSVIPALQLAFSPIQAIAQTAPAVAGELVDRVEVLLEVIRCVRRYPDFDESGWLGEMMDQALEGKTPDCFSTIEALSRGVAPSQEAKQ